MRLYFLIVAAGITLVIFAPVDVVAVISGGIVIAATTVLGISILLRREV